MASGIDFVQLIISAVAFIILYFLMLLLLSSGYRLEKKGSRNSLIIAGVSGGVFFVLSLIKLFIPQMGYSGDLIFSVVGGLIILGAMTYMTLRIFQISFWNSFYFSINHSNFLFSKGSLFISIKDVYP